MQLRHHPNGHQNVILCFLGCTPGHFLQVTQRDTDSYLQENYPGVIKIMYLPSSFSSVVKFLKVESSVSGYFQNHFLLNQQLTSFFSNTCSGHYDSLETFLFPMEGCVVDFCLNLIIDEYIQVTSEGLTSQKVRRSYIGKGSAAKKPWIIGCHLQLNNEQYLGVNSFDAELKRSCGEYHKALKNSLGYCLV
jgi:hypothetical protein